MVLIIVESPTKSKTIKSFLGKGYEITSSFGHIRDLPKSKLGVDVENNFEPKYIIPVKAKKTIKELKEKLKKSDQVILATDEDREGEAIAWHLKETLGLKNSQRIVFHEITEKAIKEALKNPREIKMDLVDAQQARRVLDRLVGYKLSPFLWKKIAKGLSAGRVQSVAVRLIVERGEEIKKFIPQEYWQIEAFFEKNKKEFSSFLYKKEDKVLEKEEIKSEKEAKEILKNLKGVKYTAEKIEKKKTKKNPPSPFMTSTLQQETWKRFKFPARATMGIAQKLYENGLITYHRTDSLNLSEQSILSAKNFIEKSFGKEYSSVRRYKAKGKAQEAHEAIRPTFIENTPQSQKMDGRMHKLYSLIWQRFTASQMSEALFDSTSIEIKAKEYTFKTNGQIMSFDGFLKVYPMKFEENSLPDIKKGEILDLTKLIPSQRFTSPPPRYNEASLIKILEKYGIGRPSTYAPTISTIQERGYILKDEQKRFYPAEIGIMVNSILIKHFPEIVDFKFTANMEKTLDRIAEGEEAWKKVCKDFYIPFEKNLEKKYQEVEKKELFKKETDKICPECGAPVIRKMGRYGEFYSCSRFPDCKHTESSEKKSLKIKCPKCNEGELIEKTTKKRKIFYACNRYPKCDFALWDKPTGEKCPECDSLLVEKGKKIKCPNKSCNFEKKE